jgi:hypothetical protein
MLPGPVHVLPAHKSCSNHGVPVGRVIGVAMKLTCEEIRDFDRCRRCVPPEKEPGRGDPRCPSCHGVGWIPFHVGPGCGAISTVDGYGCRVWLVPPKG